MKDQIIKQKQDLTYLEWSKIRHTSGTAGSFLKSYEKIGNTKTYYKLSDYDSIKGVIGHESVNEIIADRLLDILGIEHLNYRLIYADIKVNGKVFSTYVCASENFRKKTESKTALDVYYDKEKKENETPLEFCIRNGWENYIYQMLVVDFLILNRDRHGANIEVLQDRKTRTIRLAPLFDHGLSFIWSIKNNIESVNGFDALSDNPVQSFVGSNSTFENLNLIPCDKLPKLLPLVENDRERLFEDLDGILAKEYLDKIWEMIWKRWNYYEDFCDKKRKRFE